ncbi:acyltransferase domain-containing protein [Kitasatospora fiedleri]|uniref:acyltransferase domain-containing protein n=1 Tax=Kitasatospora fiedleri TaxID=2991545 RepID=UPI0038511E4A
MFALEVALFRLVEWRGSAGFRGGAFGGRGGGGPCGGGAVPGGCLCPGEHRSVDAGVAGGGAMVSVQASRPGGGGVAGAWCGVAAVNAPDAVVVSGDEAAVAAVAEVWRARGRRVRRLEVSHAFHSARMDPVLDELAQVARGLSFGEPVIPVVSTWPASGGPGEPGTGAAGTGAGAVRGRDGVAEGPGGDRFSGGGPAPVAGAERPDAPSR